MRRRVTVTGVLIATLAGATLVSAQDVGLPLGTVPDAVQLETLDGTAVDLADYIGRKPVLIEFWATWCPLCEALEPKLHAVRRTHGDALAIIIVAVGVNQNPRSIRRHTANHDMPDEILFDARGRATRAFRAPTTSYVVALDATGRVVYTGVGEDQDLAGAAQKALGQD